MNDTYTCATEGCGEPIVWREYLHDMRWVHEPFWIVGCRAVHRKLKGSWPDWERTYAHPAGGTNTTPPEELERDVKERTYKWTQDELLVQMNCQLAEIATLKAEVADLREQLDDLKKPLWAQKEQPHVKYAKELLNMVSLADLKKISAGISAWFESESAPLEAECQHLKGHTPQNFGPFVHYDFCPRCGESLTKEGEA